MEPTERISNALRFARIYGSTDGDSLKMWVIDQMVRALLEDKYDEWVKERCAGEDGPETYSWDVGVAP